MTASSKNITAFSFATPAATGAVDGTEIVVKVPISTDVTELVATFTITGASVEVDSVAQATGVTANDFTDVVTYTVIATDLTEQEYTVEVLVSHVTALQLAQIRRMVAEPTTTTYSDALLRDYIERYPHMDEYGESPLDEFGAVNSDWTPTYDSNAAAGDIWEEKAALKIEKFDFSADGGSFSMSQQFEMMMKQCRFYRARKLPTTVRVFKSPKETTIEESWIGNLPEPRT